MNEKKQLKTSTIFSNLFELILAYYYFLNKRACLVSTYFTFNIQYGRSFQKIKFNYFVDSNNLQLYIALTMIYYHCLRIMALFIILIGFKNENVLHIIQHSSLYNVYVSFERILFMFTKVWRYTCVTLYYHKKTKFRSCSSFFLYF